MPIQKYVQLNLSFELKLIDVCVKAVIIRSSIEYLALKKIAQDNLLRKYTSSSIPLADNHQSRRRIKKSAPI